MEHHVEHRRTKRRVPTSCHCGAERRPHQRTCLACHAAWSKEHRTAHRDMTPEQRKRANCRSYTKVLQARGGLPKGPCEGCGHAEAQNHHHWGYDNPRWFIRLCTGCHRSLEAILRVNPAQPLPAIARRRSQKRVSYCHADGCAGRRNCKACRNIYSRATRKRFSQLSDEARLRSNCRSYATTYKRRGKLVPQPCEQCHADASLSRMHHEDYTKPLVVRWFCAECLKALRAARASYSPDRSVV